MNTIQNTLLKSTKSDAATTTSGTSGAASGTSSAQATKEAADRFLTLLVAQLQNQDPLNPMDNAQMTTQLAQINTVSGINQLNDTVSALGASLGISQTMQAAGLVGHDVVVGGNDLDLASGAAHGGMNLSGPADVVKVTVSDASGNVVRTIDLGPQKAGQQFFDWDGKTDAGATAPDGHYTFAVTANASGKPVTLDTLMQARVQGVSSTPTGAMLQLPRGNLVALAQVVQIH